MNDQTRLTLTDEQLEEITQAAALNWVDGVVLTFAAFDVDLRSPEGPSVKPSDYAIPTEQWKRISTACGSSTGSLDPLASANHMLDWMNYGPSAFDPEPFVWDAEAWLDSLDPAEYDEFLSEFGTDRK